MAKKEPSERAVDANISGNDLQNSVLPYSVRLAPYTGKAFAEIAQPASKQTALTQGRARHYQHRERHFDQSTSAARRKTKHNRALGGRPGIGIEKYGPMAGPMGSGPMGQSH